jgi:hypothetical protein
MATTALAPARVRVPASLQTGAILVAALILRLAATIIAFRRCPPAVQVHANSEMLAVARSLAQGHGFSSPFPAWSGPTAFLSPGYPLLVAGFLRIFGVSAVALVGNGSSGGCAGGEGWTRAHGAHRTAVRRTKNSRVFFFNLNVFNGLAWIQRDQMS